MNTILVVTSDDALRARLMVALGDHSVFTAARRFQTSFDRCWMASVRKPI